MHEANKLFIDMCLEELVYFGKMDKKRAKLIYDICLDTYNKFLNE